VNQRKVWSLSLATLVLLGGFAFPAWSETETPAGPDMRGEGPVKKVKMYARNWDWTPDEIRVKLGTRVIIDFVSEDASHGFELKAYKIKVNLPQDKRGRIEFVADKAGTFPWRCSRPCGNGCAKMTGTLVVVE